MKKFVPYEKLSKKEKRRFDQAKRQTWGSLNPITRKPPNSRVYDRKKAQKQWASALSFCWLGRTLFSSILQCCNFL